MQLTKWVHEPFTFSNIFSLETARLIEAKFRVEASWDRGMKVCSNGLGHMTNMATMLIYGKKLKKSSSLEPNSRWPYMLVCNIKYSSTTKIVQMMTLSWPCPILWQGQIWSLRPKNVCMFQVFRPYLRFCCIRVRWHASGRTIVNMLSVGQPKDGWPPFGLIDQYLG